MDLQKKEHSNNRVQEKYKKYGEDAVSFTILNTYDNEYNKDPDRAYKLRYNKETKYIQSNRKCLKIKKKKTKKQLRKSRMGYFKYGRRY
jgi:hypothetical protein